MSEQKKQLPSMAIAAMLFLLVGAFWWVLAAAQYAHAEQGWRTEGVAGTDRDSFSTTPRRTMSRRKNAETEALADLIYNAFRQIPRAPAVVRYNIENRLWLIGIFVVLELGVVGIAIWMRSLERQMSQPKKRHKRKGFVPPT